MANIAKFDRAIREDRFGRAPELFCVYSTVCRWLRRLWSSSFNYLRWGRASPKKFLSRCPNRWWIASPGKRANIKKMSLYRFVKSSSSSASDSRSDPHRRLFVQGTRENDDRDNVRDVRYNGQNLQTVRTQRHLSTDVFGSSEESSKKFKNAGTKYVTTRVVRKTTTLTRGEEKSVSENSSSSKFAGESSTLTKKHHSEEKSANSSYRASRAKRAKVTSKHSLAFRSPLFFFYETCSKASLSLVTFSWSCVPKSHNSDKKSVDVTCISLYLWFIFLTNSSKVIRISFRASCAVPSLIGKPRKIRWRKKTNKISNEDYHSQISTDYPSSILRR